MMVNLKKSSLYYSFMFGSLLFIGSCFYIEEAYLLMLTAAQLLFVPILFQLFVTSKIVIRFTWLGMMSIFLLHIASSGSLQIVFALIYLIYTFIVALNGVKRFLHRGFTNWAEIAIDVAMLYLFVGGIWFLIYTAGFNVGYSLQTNWLTAIHFHYSGFLFCISLGFFGRLHHSKLYQFVVPIILAGPFLVAFGIIFSRLFEFISVLLYIFAIYSVMILAYRTTFTTKIQAICIRLSYSALGFTILFSMLYAANRAFGLIAVSIDFMLLFHGIVNCLMFGMIGSIGWTLAPPLTKQRNWSFPVSKIRGRLKGTGAPVHGLVEHLNDFVHIENVPRTVVDFYEQTRNYRLYSSVKWSLWIKPFILIYKWISHTIQQLNLPISSENIEMKGDLFAIDPILDGRRNPRVWIRKIKGNTVFAAIYSQHETAGQTYMNIALPLPFSTMVGVLQLSEVNGTLILTSTGDGDAGIYLSLANYLFKLPLSEYFMINEEEAGSLSALHKMKIFGIPFLQIDYHIVRNQG